MALQVLHFLNQFFAGMGGEEKAGLPLQFLEGPVGPGRRLQELLGESAKILVTASCGDDYFPQNKDRVIAAIEKLAKERRIDIVVAGPAFNSGRYGLACVEICNSLSKSLGQNAVAGIAVENPATEIYKSFKNLKFYALPSASSVSGMEEALSRMAKFTKRLVSNVPIGGAAAEGYIPRGIRVFKDADKSASKRAVDMLLDKYYGRPFNTEIPIVTLDRVPAVPPLANLKNACIALATTAGVAPPDNPDGFKMYKNTFWKKYSIEKLESMTEAKWDAFHGGYNTEFMRHNANYGVPLDACRQLQREGAFGSLYPYFYGTPGNQGGISVMKELGVEMARDMKAGGVDGVLLVST